MTAPHNAQPGRWQQSTGLPPGAAGRGDRVRLRVCCASAAGSPLSRSDRRVSGAVVRSRKLNPERELQHLASDQLSIG